MNQSNLDRFLKENYTAGELNYIRTSMPAHVARQLHGHANGPAVMTAHHYVSNTVHQPIFANAVAIHPIIITNTTHHSSSSVGGAGGSGTYTVKHHAPQIPQVPKIEPVKVEEFKYYKPQETPKSVLDTMPVWNLNEKS